MLLQNYKLKYSTTTNNKVFVAGTFSNWAPKEMTPQGDGCFTFEVNILEKELLFKFIEDGVWLCSGLYETRRDEQGNMNNVMIGTPLESPPKPVIPAAPELPVATSNGLKPPLALEIADSPAEQIQIAPQLPPIVHQDPITSSILGGRPEPAKGQSLPEEKGDESPLPLAPITTTVSPNGLMVPVVPASEASKLPAPAIVGASETTLNSKKDKGKPKEGKSMEKKKFSWKRLFKFGKA